MFDLDGLLVDSEKLFFRVGERLLERRGKRFTQRTMSLMLGRPARQAYANMAAEHGLDEPIEELIKEGRRLFFELMDQEGIDLMPGAAELLEYVQSLNMPVGLATSSGRHYTERVLEAVGLSDRFAFVLTSDDIKLGKPHPEIYLLSARRHGVSPQALLVFEDSPAGLQAAVSAGAQCIVVPSPYTPDADWRGASLVASRLDSPEVFAFIAQRANTRC